MREKLIIISDLWGKEKSEWLINYTRILEPKFDIVFYDSCELGQIDKSNYTQENLHNQFINGGIEKAVERLLEYEKLKINILAFSIGGTIAWNFGLKRDNINSLLCISSTRLRKEIKKPKGKLKLLFGENDEFKPKADWFKNMNLDHIILSGKGHQVYRELEFAERLSENLIKNKTTPQQWL